MKPLTLLLFALFLVLQYALWVAPNGVAQAWNLHHLMIALKTKNNDLAKRNAILSADIDNLKHGGAAIEERARNQLGMIKQGEVFYQLLKK